MQERIARLLKGSGMTLSAAESCTGGEISHLITLVSGSSEYYLGSVTSYAVSVKEKVLGVDGETVRKTGVVSSEVAAAMAEGVRRLTGSDYSIATTGNAGPTAAQGQEVGLVWVAVSSSRGTQTKAFNYKNDRTRNIERFSAAALHLLLTKLRAENN